MINKLDFSGQLLTAKGDQTGVTLGETLSNLLMTAPAKPPISTKYFSWGLDLVKPAGTIEVDDVDKKALIELIDQSEQITVLVKGRLHEVLDGISIPEAKIPIEKRPAIETEKVTIDSGGHGCTDNEEWSDILKACVPKI